MLDREQLTKEIFSSTQNMIAAHEADFAEHNRDAFPTLDIGRVIIMKSSDHKTLVLIDDRDHDARSAPGVVSRVVLDGEGNLELAEMDVFGPNRGVFTREITAKRIPGFLAFVLDALEVEANVPGADVETESNSDKE